MSIFSSSVQSQIIDPVFTSNNRCEFRLANRGESYMPTMRLGNLGLSKSVDNVNSYHFGPGASCVIDRIQLLDGNEQLDGLNRAGNWLTFKNSLHTNSQNVNVFSDLVGGSLGWSAGATGELLSNHNKVIRQGEPTTLGTLDLREVFPILNSVSHLSTKLFKNLRIVIEYHTKNIALVNQQAPAANATDGLAKTIPLLVVDEIIDEALAASLDASLKSAEWVAVESDVASVPQVAGITNATANPASAVQNNNLRINGFQNKAVSRVMIAKVYQDLDNYIYSADTTGTVTGVRGIAQYGSRALHKEEFNIRINGRNVLAGNGVDTPMSMAMLCADTWGELNICPGQVTEAVGLDSKYSLFDTNVTPTGRPCKNWVGANKTTPSILEFGGKYTDATKTAWAGGDEPTSQQGIWVGNAAWLGVGVHDRVSDMQIQLTRTGTPSSARTPATPATDTPVSSVGNYQALNILVFAEVAKRLDISGGEYKVSYA
tara:strand:+ start:5252 stop:6712 length:1461 start_codon:yes stop_codon:yes gene_type:complete